MTWKEVIVRLIEDLEIEGHTGFDNCGICKDIVDARKLLDK